MTKSRKSQVAIAVAAASLAGGGAAIAGSGTAHSNTHGSRTGGPAGRAHDDLSVAATYLGLSDTELQTELRSGKSLAEIANAIDGKSASGLIDALVAAARKHITARVNSTGPPPLVNGRPGEGPPPP